jgi:uncharacterized protein YdiU (UPF0061 family)
MQLHHFYASQLADLCSPVHPLAVARPRVAMRNLDLAKSLGIDGDALGDEHLLAMLFSVSKQGALRSVAQKYGGHQFGHWNPQLGDGRGLLLGEIVTPQNTLCDLHLKGAGPTPYSRHADGRAVLRSTVREYIGSEALHALGIPSSRSLCLIASEEPVMREKLEPGAMMIRTCPSHIRFGHFEYFHYSNEKTKLDSLFEFCFEHHFSHLKDSHNPHLGMLTEIVQNTATLIAHWQAYGFNHGVMNTDNMSIHGITFDYGPYAFLDDFIPNYICNHSDHSGRYAFDQQPSIALWNLNALAHGFSQYVEIEDLKAALSEFEPLFIETYQRLMHKRLGLGTTINDNTQHCIHEFTQMLRDEFADYHIPFRALSEHLPDVIAGKEGAFTRVFEQHERASNWARQYGALLHHKPANGPRIDIHNMQQDMLGCNPKYVLRNHHLQKAIVAAEQNDFSVCERLLDAVSHPFETNATFAEFAQPPHANEKGIALSCSS